MADNFNASLVISTSAAVSNVRNLDSASKDLDKTLAHLHTTMSANQGDMTKISKALKDFTVAQDQSNKNAGTRQQNQIREARLEREGIINKSKAADETRKQTKAEADLAAQKEKGGRASASALGNEVRKNSTNDVRNTNATALATARATTEAERLAAAQQRTGAATAQRSAAEARAELTTMRLAAAQEKASNSNLALNDSLSNSRYLLFDVGATYTALSVALLAIPAATMKVASSYEKDFAQVIRTTGLTGQAANQLSEELKTMATQIPLSFGELAGISAIAGQLGIGKAEIGAFTETVAKFGAASNVSINEAATAFGRLENSFNPDKTIPDFFNKVGSAVAYVGVNSAATETEIIAVSNQISAAGAQFKFSADQIVGLSGALASIRIRPELARGAFQRIMLGLSRAADEGAASFDQFGKYTGLAADQSLSLFKQDPSAFFNQYIAGISGTIAKGTSVSTVLDDIGAKNVFDKQFILGLANNMGVYNQSLSDSAKAFKEGTFLDSSTAGIFDTFAATVERVKNAFSNLAATMGAGPLAALKPAADIVLNMTTATDRLIQSVPGLKLVVGGFMLLATVTGVLLGLKAAQAFVLAGLVGLQQVMGKTAIAGALSLRGNVSELAKTMLMAKGATAELAGQLLAGRTAMNQFMLATTTTTAGVQRLATAGTLAGYELGVAAAATTRASGAMKLFSGALSLVGGPIGALIIGAGLLVTSFISTQEAAKQAGDEIARALKNGSEAGVNKALAKLDELKVGLTDSIAIGNMDQKFTQVARDAGVPLEKIAQAAAKGTSAGTEMLKVLDEIAHNKGYADFKDMRGKNALGGTEHTGQMQFLLEKVTQLGNESAATTANLVDVDSATNKLGQSANGAAKDASGLDTGLEDVGGGAEKATTKLNDMLDAIFGFVDAQAATQSALGKLGEGLQKSADFTTSTDAGRSNIADFRDAMKSAALEQKQLFDSGKQGAQESAANYTAFVDGLVSQMVAKGVDPTAIQALADQAKGVVATQFASGEQPKLIPTIDAGPVTGEIVMTTAKMQDYIRSAQPTVTPTVDSSESDKKIYALVMSLVQITGYPYKVVMDALTNPASDKATEIAALMTSITDHTYTAPIGADTSAAITNVQDFSDYARKELATLQAAYNNVLKMSQTSKGFMKGAANDILGKGWDGSGVQTYFGPQPIASKAAAPVPVAAKAPAVKAPNFSGLTNGYNDAAKAAEKAGEKGKKAAEDMANGIDDATAAVNDYAARLKTGLQSAFDKQYGMQKASDDYYKTLNAIAKKREDELGQLDDLIVKQKELNTARQGDLVDARKAGTEKAISLKYGEGARAADYAQQEQTALDAAAAKQKDIEANNKTSASLKAGLNDFTSNTDAAIANREALRDLESKTLDMIAAYAATGASQEQVRAYAQKLTAQFQTDAGQVFQNRIQVDGLIGDMGRYISVINSVPEVKPVKVTADTAQAQNDIADVARALDGLHDRDVAVTFKGHLVSDNNTTSDGQPIYRVIGPDGEYHGAKLFNKGGQVQGFAGGGQIPGKSPSNPNVDNRMATVDGKGMIKVRSGEFIVQQPAVDYWGLDMFKNLNNMKMPAFNGGGPVGGGSGGPTNGVGVVALDAETLGVMAGIFQQELRLYVDSKELASSVNTGQKKLVAEGANR